MDDTSSSIGYRLLQLQQDESLSSSSSETAAPLPLLTWSGTFGATIAVLLTTLDDSVWLASFVGSSSLNIKSRWVHALTFLISLMTLSIICCIVAVGVQAGVATAGSSNNNNDENSFNEEKLEIILEAIAASVCWILAIGFFIKKQLKRRKRQQQQQQKEKEQPNKETIVDYGTVTKQQTTNNDNGGNDDGTADAEGGQQQQQQQQQQGKEKQRQAPTSSQPCTVISLTTIGFLDEISYFPTLIIGGIVTPYELCLATFFAALIMLAIQVFLATQFKPLIDFLDDHVPLYGIIATFAIILTIQLIWDLVF